MSELFERLQEELKTLKQRDGLSPSDLLGLPPALAAILRKIMRQNGMKLAEIATEVNQPPENTQKFLDELVDKGYLRQVQGKQEVVYKANFGDKKARRSQDRTRDIWSALDS